MKGGSGGTPKSTNKDYYGDDIPFLSISDVSNSSGYINNTEKHITKKDLKIQLLGLFRPVPSVSQCMLRWEKIAILNIDAATSQAFYNMVFEDYNLRDFTYQHLNRANESGEWLKLISTGTQSNLNAEKVKNFSLTLPTIRDEMKSVSKFLMVMDNHITLHQSTQKQIMSIKEEYLNRILI